MAAKKECGEFCSGCVDGSCELAEDALADEHDAKMAARRGNVKHCWTHREPEGLRYGSDLD